MDAVRYRFLNGGMEDHRQFLDRCHAKNLARTKYRRELRRIGFPCVYVVQLRDWDGPYKIGYSKNVNRRIHSIQTNHPEEIHLRRFIPGTRDDEAACHAIFAEHRLRGEWFAPVQAIRDLADPEKPLPEWFGKPWIYREMVA